VASVAKDAEIGTAQLDLIPTGDRAVAAAAAAAMSTVAQYCNTRAILGFHKSVKIYIKLFLLSLYYGCLLQTPCAS